MYEETVFVNVVTKTSILGKPPLLAESYVGFCQDMKMHRVVEILVPN